MLTLLLLLALAGSAGAATPAQGIDVDTCLGCHADRSLAVSLPSGETRSLFVNIDAFRASVHGNKLSCTDCHQDITEIPHASRPFKTLREFTVAYYEQCKRCHFANYTKTLDSVHYQSLARGDRTAPLCVDCHGSHEIVAPRSPAGRVSNTCARCHQGVTATYAMSVHGKVAATNTDVPTCTDCHRSHDISGPRTANWQQHIPDLCSNCHSNKALMDKYGLSSSVNQTYVADFHGMTASLQKDAGGARSSVVALCTDCHGVHDITKVDDPSSRVLRANLVKTCARCHEGAGDNFPAAWMSHYAPTWEKAPMVFAVQKFYDVLIPFMMIGLLLQILLHFWRVVVNR